LKPIDVGAVVEPAGADAVAAAVAGQKGHALPLERADDVGVRRRAEGRVHAHLLDVGEMLDAVDAAAADDADANG
jgi:hypothetical protein